MQLGACAALRTCLVGASTCTKAGTVSFVPATVRLRDRARAGAECTFVDMPRFALFATAGATAAVSGASTAGVVGEPGRFAAVTAGAGSSVTVAGYTSDGAGSDVVAAAGDARVFLDAETAAGTTVDGDGAGAVLPAADAAGVGLLEPSEAPFPPLREVRPCTPRLQSTPTYRCRTAQMF